MKRRETNTHPQRGRKTHTHTYIHSPTAQIHLLWVMIGSPIETTTTTADDDVVVASVGVSD